MYCLVDKLNVKQTQVEWMASQQVFSVAAGGHISQPFGPVCKVDGTAAEAFPLYTLTELLEQMKDPLFKKEFMLVRQGVQAANLVALRREEVQTESFFGLRMVRQVAFIRREEFSRIGAGELGSPSCSAPALQLPSYSGTPGELVEGTIVELDEVPPDCHYEMCECFMHTGRKHAIELLGPDRTFRKGQCGERFQQSVSSMVSKRPQALKGSPGTAPRIQKYIKEHKDFQELTPLQNQQAQENQGIQAQVHITSHSTADDDDGVADGMGVKPKTGGK